MRKLRYLLDPPGVSLLALFCAFATAQAKDPGEYVISAKAGGVNLLSGGVMLQHKGRAEWQRLVANDRLDSGDVVRTDANGRLEILLNPGSYMRVGADSEFELTDPALNSLRIKLIKGTSIVEASGLGGAKLVTEVDTPQTKIAIVQNGLYRINLRPNTTELFVRKGRALVGSNAPITVKRGKKIAVSGPGNIVVAKFDKKIQDSFDLWSLQRAETLIAANRRLSNANLAYSIVSAVNKGWGYDPWRHRGLGVWIYDPLLACHTFYPFYSGISSPYGYSYSSGLGLARDYYKPSAPNAPTPLAGSAMTGRGLPQPPVSAGGDLPVRPVPVDRHEEREIRERAFRDFYHSRDMDTFDRAAGHSSQSVHPEPEYHPAPVSPPTPSAGSPSEPRGRMDRAESRISKE